MEETLFDSEGNAVAYIAHDDSFTIYKWDGTPVAYLENDGEIYGFNGKHLGWFEDNIIWNLIGERIGYNKQSLSVFAKFEPFKSFKKFKPFKSFKEFSKFKPFKSQIKSDVHLSDFLDRGEK